MINVFKKKDKKRKAWKVYVAKDKKEEMERDGRCYTELLELDADVYLKKIGMATSLLPLMIKERRLNDAVLKGNEEALRPGQLW